MTEGRDSIDNARLIAAAPDLLEALRDMVHWHGTRDRKSNDLLPPHQQEPEVAKAMAAIARAEGR